MSPGLVVARLFTRLLGLLEPALYRLSNVLQLVHPLLAACIRASGIPSSSRTFCASCDEMFTLLP